MNTGRKMLPQAANLQHKQCQRPSQQSHTAGIMQMKAAVAPQIKRPPTAPPVYRPQPAPKVLQAKMRFPHQPLPADRAPVAAPVSRFNPTPKLSQPKTAGGQQPAADKSSRHFIAPPVHRPSQKKTAQPKMPVTAQPRQLPTAPPPVYRPQPKSLQPKQPQHARAGMSTKPTTLTAPQRPQRLASAPLTLQAKMAIPKAASQSLRSPVKSVNATHQQRLANIPIQPKPLTSLSSIVRAQSRTIAPNAFSAPTHTIATIQRLRIGKIPSSAFRAAHITSRAYYNYLVHHTNYHHDVADFTAPMRSEILEANDDHFSNVGGVVPNPLPPPGSNFASDESSTQLWRHREIRAQTAEIDHVIPYQHWGCNDFRNARVISSQENNPGPVSRPAANDFRVVCLDNRRIAGVDYERDQLLTVNELNDLLEEADNRGAVATHDGNLNPLGAVNQMTNSDFAAIYNVLPQE